MRLSLLSSKQQETHARSTQAFSHLLFKQQETPGFEVLQRRSLCYHISAAAMLPVKLCST